MTRATSVRGTRRGKGMSGIVATFIRRLDGFTGVANLYRLSEPVKYGWDDDEGEKNHSQYVIVSAISAMFSGPETYIFPADANGKIIDWAEMHGSYKGGLSHAEAIKNAGWSLAR